MLTRTDDEADDDDIFLRRLIMCEEDRRRLFPTSTWAGGYRWFKAGNVVPLEYYRQPKPIPRQKAS